MGLPADVAQRVLPKLLPKAAALPSLLVLWLRL
jgi:hypothetical protein